jgi:hypothetical protein
MKEAAALAATSAIAALDENTLMVIIAPAPKHYSTIRNITMQKESSMVVNSRSRDRTEDPYVQSQEPCIERLLRLLFFFLPRANAGSNTGAERKSLSA